MSKVRLKPEHRMARLIRALSGLTQEEMSRETGISVSLIDQFEQGHVIPSGDHLEKMAACAGMTATDAAEHLRLHRTQRATWLRGSEGLGAVLDHLARRLRRHCTGAMQRLLKLRVPERPPSPEDRQQAEEQFLKLKRLSRRSRLAVVRSIEEFQSWALAERCCDESVLQASRNLRRAASWAQLALEIARLIPGQKGWRRRVRAYALAHWGNILRVKGELNAADVAIGKAKQLWQLGSDPYGLLDPGRLLDLEGALRRAQRRFTEAFSCFDEAIPVSRFPERSLLNKGFTYEVMGDYPGAVATFRAAEPLVERRADPRLRNILRLNLSNVLVHAARHAEAAELVEEVRRNPEGLGKIDIARIPWLEGRIQHGLGRRDEALRLLAQARESFEAEEMFYDVALALLEESSLLLEENRTQEVKELTRELPKVFASKGVHREALAALQVFQEAVEREAATAELVRRILGFLFRARFDQGLQFPG
jgi:transcriptional regulator with XRE-family HTH domain